jgi:hypothetical protein
MGLTALCLAIVAAAFTNPSDFKASKKTTTYYWFPTHPISGSLTQTSANNPGQQDVPHNRLGCDQVANFFCANGYLASNPGITVSGSTVTVSTSATPDAIVKKSANP